MLLAGRQQADILVLLAIQKGLQVLEVRIHTAREGKVVFQKQSRFLPRVHKHPQAIHVILSGSLGGIGCGFAQLMNYVIERCSHTSQFSHRFLPTIPAGFQIHDLNDIHTGPRRITLEDIMLD